MLYSYGITQIGSYHVEKDLVCQDAHFIRKLSDHFAVAAVADGLGSESRSDIASKIAAEQSVSYCVEHLNETSSDQEMLQTIHEAFKTAFQEIQNTAKSANEELTEYDTTLSLAVYRDGRLFYGNSGDSGIVVLHSDGLYESVTEQQRDENGYVYPLCFEDKWVFGLKENVSSVFLATDGMLETLFPYLLRNETVTIYVALARFFMDERLLDFEKIGENGVRQKMDAFIASISPTQVNDDKTVLVMVDTDYPSELQADEYYSTPDWAMLKEKHDEAFRRAAYPDLYANNGE